MSATVVAATVVVSRRGTERVLSGHPWIYRSDVISADAEPGDLVRVMGEPRRKLGRALWSSTSQIALRMIDTSSAQTTERELFMDRLRAAVAYRARLAIDGTAWRLVNGEADRLPALVVDRYGHGAEAYLVLQTLCQGMDRRMSLIAECLQELLSPAGILARNDPKVRRLEGLDERVDVVAGEVPERIEIREGTSKFFVDARHGQKTGMFLDQRENHLVAGRLARGRALDAFAYHGGFALAMARGAESVLALDSSAPAIAALREHAALNGVTNIEARDVNVFDELRELEVAGARFDTIVLDPPAFAKNKASVERAVAGYNEINLRAMKLLSVGGTLMTCSCSYNVDEGLFTRIVEHAATDAHATMVLVEHRLQAADHPVLLNVPETRYLKCLVLRKIA